MSRLAVALSFALSLAACQSSTSPQVRVLGVHQAPASHVFVQVTNPAQRPLRLQKLEYVCRKLQVKEGDHILHLGCGSGGFALYAAQTHGAIVHSITRAHEGTLTLAPRAAGGLCVTVRLPPTPTAS